MEEDLPQLELYIDTCDEQLDQALQNIVLGVFGVFVIKHTLDAVSISSNVMLTLLITDDKTIQSLNKQYRQQDKPTDVLSFPLLDEPLVEAPADQLWAFETEENDKSEPVDELPAFVSPPEMLTNLGDIVISWPTLQKQAIEAGHTPLYELFFLLSHGVLHLVGYDDQSEAGYQTMVQIQQSVLLAVGQKA